METLKILAIQWSNNNYYNLHIVSNWNATYITYTIINWTLKEKKDQIKFLIDTHNFYYKIKKKGFDLNDFNFTKPKIKFINFN